MICYKKQKRHRHHGNVFRLNVFSLLIQHSFTILIVSNHIVSNRYCAALSHVVGAVVGVAAVDAGVGVALTGTAKYF